MSRTNRTVPADLHSPVPPSERRAWLIACAVASVGIAVFVAAVTGLVGGSVTTVAPPPVPVVAATPVAATQSARSSAAAAPVARPAGVGRILDATQSHIDTRWMEGFYPIYETAQRTFAVNWLLLASIHRQESAFSTAPGTYHGLNFAHCCGGPMQFNVRNGGGRGTLSTWDLVSDSYMYGRRPAAYDHMTAMHPSIYDDFDAIMAAAHLLSADGAGVPLDDSAWVAAYDYYGHDSTGVLYADEVLARAILWSQHGFCVNCGVTATMVNAVDAAYGAPVRVGLEAVASRDRAVAARRRNS